MPSAMKQQEEANSSIFDETINLETPSTSIMSQGMGSLSASKRHLGADVPYVEAIREIEKMQTCVNPRDMLGCLSSAFAQLKSVVVDHHKGKVEL